MIPVVGVFRKFGSAQAALGQLRILGLDQSTAYLASPAGGPDELALVPTSGGEQPGMAGAFGALLGCALGIAGGFSVGAPVSWLVTLGNGSALAVTISFALALGLFGGVAGYAVGARVDRIAQDGLPSDEFYLYQDALAQGRSVLTYLARTRLEHDEARQAFIHAGAESVDRARNIVWLGTRDAGLQRYVPPPPKPPAPNYFADGFSAALRREYRGKPWDQVLYLLVEQYRDWWEDGFRKGFERGQQFRREIESRSRHSRPPGPIAA
jgi:hypothetical protein